MFAKNIYVERRKQVRQKVGSGLILLLGNMDAPMNYPANVYRFRQDSNFLYFSGIDMPGLALVLDTDEGSDTLFADDVTMDDIVWMGPQPSMKSIAQKSGIKNQNPMAKLEERIVKGLRQGRRIHILPAYRGDKILWLERLLGIQASALRSHVSLDLIRAIVEMRSSKTPHELLEIESALKLTAAMFEKIRKQIRPGLRENEISGKLEGTALEAGCRLAFPAIVTVRGETLHNSPTSRHMKDGDLLLVDTGAESVEHYASDITRTFPVSGKFTPRQKEIYQIVFKMQSKAIQAIRPGVCNREIHLLAARTMVEGMKSIGLMKGNTDNAVAAGAHALFFPHGLGHMMGLDVHDMEDLGENLVGYDEKTDRSKQFGLANLRLARKLQPGFVVTVEPGLYFIPALIDKWKAEKKHLEFISFQKLESYKGFGGIRIEDDLLVTRNGARVIGPSIPKEIGEIGTDL